MTALIALALILVGAAITSALTRAAYRAGHEAAVGRVVASLRTLQQTIAEIEAMAPQAAAITATADLLEEFDAN